MQNEDRRVGSDGVEFIKCGHAPFGKLKLAPAADHPNPLPGWRPMDLLFQHAQPVCKRGHTVPTKLEIVGKTATDDMGVRVVQTGDQPPPFEVDDAGIRAALEASGIVHTDDTTVLDRDISGVGILGVERGDLSVYQDHHRGIFFATAHRLRHAASAGGIQDTSCSQKLEEVSSRYVSWL